MLSEFSETSSLPIPLSKAMLAVTPSAALAHVVEVVWGRLQRRHPKLIKNLERLDPALVYLDPTDIPHSFALTLGTSVSFYVVSEAEKKAREPDAQVAGKLESLINMLEGREDGDSLFFSRDIQINGKTEVIVGLRNTLDREEMDLMDEVLSLCGPFAKPVGVATQIVDRFVRRVSDRIHHAHDQFHDKKVS